MTKTKAATAVATTTRASKRATPKATRSKAAGTKAAPRKRKATAAGRTKPAVAKSDRRKRTPPKACRATVGGPKAPGTDQQHFADQGQRLHPVFEGALLVPLDAIVVESNCRRHVDDGQMRKLVDDVNERGLLKPLLVRSRPDGTYLLIAGWRRYTAASRCNYYNVPVMARNDLKGTFGGEAGAQLVENLNVEPMSEMDIAERLAEIEAANGTELTEAQLAKVATTPHEAAYLKRLLPLPSLARQAVSRKEIKPATGVALARIAQQSSHAESVVNCLAERIKHQITGERDLRQRPGEALTELAYDRERPDDVFLVRVTGENLRLRDAAEQAKGQLTKRANDSDADGKLAAKTLQALEAARTKAAGLPEEAYLRRMQEEDVSRAVAARVAVAVALDEREDRRDTNGNPSPEEVFVCDPVWLAEWAAAEFEALAAEGAPKRGAAKADEQASKDSALLRAEREAARMSARSDNYEVGRAMFELLNSGQETPLEAARVVIGCLLAGRERDCAQGMRLTWESWHEQGTTFNTRSGSETTTSSYPRLSGQGDTPSALELLHDWLLRADSAEELFRRFARAFLAGQLCDQEALPSSERIGIRSLPVADDDGTLTGRVRAELWAMLTKFKRAERARRRLRPLLDPDQDSERPDPLAQKIT